jgi:hypothetical protein
MPIATDVAVDISGNIRYVGAEHGGGSPGYYTVLELHRFLQGLADDAVASGDDLIDITDDTPSDRATDNIITLLGSYNIDDLMAEHLYDGSITQGSGITETRYSGIVVVGAVNNTATELVLVRNNQVLKNYWGTVANTPANLKDSAANILLRTLVKSRDAGLNIDAAKVRVQARHLQDTYAEFGATLGLGNATAAIFTNSDLNNQNNDATIAALSGITNVEGWQEIDLGNGNGNQPYYSQWNRAANSINDLYEWAKWIQQRPPSEDSATNDSSTNYIVDDNDTTSLGRAQSWQMGTPGERITKVVFNLKIGAGTPTGTMYAEIDTHSGATYGTNSVPGESVQATSDTVDVGILTTTYQPVEFLFSGAQQVLLTAATNYTVIIHHDDGTAANYVHVEGDATGTHSGNMATESPATTWTATAAADLDFEVHTSPDIHSMSGELFRGITHQITYTLEAGGPFTEDEVIAWGTIFDYNTEASFPFVLGEKVNFSGSGAYGTLIYFRDDGTSGQICVAVEPGSGTVIDTDTPIGATSNASCNIVTGTVEDPAAVGGTGQILALDDQGTTGTIWIQLLTGSAPATTLPLLGLSSDAYCEANVITPRTLSPSFLGTSTGSALIGAYGIGVESTDLTSNDLLTALDGNTQQPPNNVQFTVAALIDSEDRVLVGPRTGSTFATGQAQLAAALTGAAEATCTLQDGTEDFTPVPGDTPASGTLRIELDNGVFKRVAYASYVAATQVFTFSAAEDFSTVNAAMGNDVFVSYIDDIAGTPGELSFTAVYQGGDRDLRVRVRDGGGTPIKTFESNATFGSANSTLNAIRTSDA